MQRFIAVALVASVCIAGFAPRTSAVESSELSAPPAVSAAAPVPNLMLIAITADYMNLRTSPFVSPQVTGSNIAYELFQGAQTWVYVDSRTYSDGYYWYKTFNDLWIAETGGFVCSGYGFADTAYGIYPDGTVAWSHTCFYPESWQQLYYFDVYEDGYEVSCDCGFTELVEWNGHWEDGSPLYKFIGVDTNNDEIPDAFPGDYVEVPHSGWAGLRDLVVSFFFEFTDPSEPAPETPYVWIIVYDNDGNVLKQMKFDYYATISRHFYGVVITGANGYKTIIPGDGNDILHSIDSPMDSLGQIGELPQKCEPIYNSEGVLQEVFRFEYVDISDIDDSAERWWHRILNALSEFGEWIGRIWEKFISLFDFIFRRTDSPYKFIIGG